MTKHQISIAGFQKTIKEQETQIKRLKTMIEIIHNWKMFKEIPLYEKFEEINAEFYHVYGTNKITAELNKCRFMNRKRTVSKL